MPVFKTIASWFLLCCFLDAAFAVELGILGAGAERPVAGTSSSPNIVMVFIDDMGYSDLSSFGGEVDTVNIDRLANEGIRFTNFYVNAPICSPSRTALTTGQYPQRWRIASYLENRKNNDQRGMAQWLDPKAPVLARQLHDAGYFTGHFGKWHMGGQRDVSEAPLITQYGFDHSLTNFEGLGPRVLGFKDSYDGSQPELHDLGSNKLGHGSIETMDRSRITGRFVERTLQHIDQALANAQPFYVNVWPDDVHSPFFPPEVLRDKTDESKRQLYLAVLKAMDDQLGVLFDRIRDTPSLRDNTLIVLCSDNGHEPGAGKSDPLRGCKGLLYEGGIRSPLIIWGPGFVQPSAVGTTNEQSVFSAIDVNRSLYALTDTQVPSGVTLDGEVVLDTMLGKSTQGRLSPIFFRRPPDRPQDISVGTPANRRKTFVDAPDLAVRDGKWKFLVNQDQSDPQLYDLTVDIGESHNLVAQHPEIAERLEQLLFEWNATLPKDAGDATFKLSPAVSRNEPIEPSAEAEIVYANSSGQAPNVVLILADDLGWNSVGYHNEEFKTPHIDAIAADGMELNRFYVAPMCSPTRAGLLTGRYPIRFGCARAVIPPYRDYGLPTSETTLPEMLGELGYQQRGIFGKWHLGHRRAKWHPLAQGFTFFHGHYNGAIDYFDLSRDGVRDWHVGYEPSDEHGYATDLIADAAADWIKQTSASESPYFCYVPFNAPHSPFQAPEDAIDRYGDAAGKLKPKAKDREMYKAMIGRMDEGIGKILNAVEASGESNNTIVWFLSDNGGVGGLEGINDPLRGAKLTVFEGGIRVPACVRWPGKISTGQTSDVVCGYVDVMPTLTALAGGILSESVHKLYDGVDLSDVLLGKSDRIQDRPWFSYHGQSGPSSEHLAVIDKGWKLVVNGPVLTDLEQTEDESHQVYLFHLSDDLTEKVDLAARHPEKVEELVRQLIEYRALQPEDAIPPYQVGQGDFIPPPLWKLDPMSPEELVGR